MIDESLVRKDVELGTKFDSDKVRPSLIPYKELGQVLKVLENGAKKYSPENWKHVPRQNYVEAFMRHALEYMEHEQNEEGVCIDKDSGIETMAHIICNALFLLYKDREQNEQEIIRRTVSEMQLQS